VSALDEGALAEAALLDTVAGCAPDDVAGELAAAEALFDVAPDVVEGELETAEDVLDMGAALLLLERTCGAEGVAGGTELSAYAVEVDANIIMKRSVRKSARRAKPAPHILLLRKNLFAFFNHSRTVRNTSPLT